jgi:hypothetical protein
MTARLLRGLALAAGASLLAAGSVSAGQPPKRLDPGLATPGWVVRAPRIHLLYWDNAWNDHHPYALRRGAIKSYVKALAGRSYLKPAAQYGVLGPATFANAYGTTLEDLPCGPRRPQTSIRTLTVHLWVTCELAPSPLVPGFTLAGGLIPTPLIPVSNQLYVVFVPSRTTITDSLTLDLPDVNGQRVGPWKLKRTACVDYGAYHAFTLAPTPLPTWVAYAVIPVRCANGSFDRLAAAISHEIVETATDPILNLGWIDRSLPLLEPDFRRFSAGEAADICGSEGAAPTPPRRVGSYVYAPYWSNRDGRCVP